VGLSNSESRAARSATSGRHPQRCATSTVHKNTIHGPNYSWSCERTPSGRIRRSSSTRRAFQELHPCPSTGATAGRCPGYVIDHIVPLKRGGADAVENMQWQSEAEARAKDRVE
jgi:hypothetical protein